MKAPPAPPSVWNRLLLAVFLLLLFAGSVGLATVWLRHQISEVAESNQRLQVQTAEIERRIAEANARVAAALNPDVLLRQNDRLRLGLAAPRDWQIVRVDEEVELRLAAKRNAELYTATVVPASLPLPPAR